MAEETAKRKGGPARFADRKRLMIFGVAFGVGFVAIILYAARVGGVARVVGSALMFAIAALIAGGLIGFLFGIPRALTSDRGSAGGGGAAGAAGAAQPGGYVANTNLEQISDWLTKILVGVSLTQFGAIQRGGAGLFTAMATSLGGAKDSAAFAGALTIYYATLGFILSWLATRLLLGQALSAADRRALDTLVAAALADEAGNPEEAAQLRRQAFDVLSLAAPAAERYEALRRSQSPGPQRTRAMEDEIATARKLAQDSKWSPAAVRALFETGEDGERIFAIGLMQGKPETAAIDLIADAVANSRSAFEQFQALAVALQLATGGHLPASERAVLAEAIQGALASAQIEAGSDRQGLAEDVLRELQSIPA